MRPGGSLLKKGGAKDKIGSSDSISHVLLIVEKIFPDPILPKSGLWRKTNYQNWIVFEFERLNRSSITTIN